MKLSEFRRMVAAIPEEYDDAEVYSEGCDCSEPAKGIAISEAAWEDSGWMVEIARSTVGVWVGEGWATRTEISVDGA